jgi:hypothetical protein
MIACKRWTKPTVINNVTGYIANVLKQKDIPGAVQESYPLPYPRLSRRRVRDVVENTVLVTCHLLLSNYKVDPVGVPRGRANIEGTRFSDRPGLHDSTWGNIFYGVGVISFVKKILPQTGDVSRSINEHFLGQKTLPQKLG